MGGATLDDLLDHAHGLGLEVVEQPLRGSLNAVLLEGGRVVLNRARSEATRCYALAHECGHWHYGHDWRLAHDRERDEHQADRYAAHLLISPIEYARAEEMFDGHLGAISRELLVPTHVLQIWQQDADSVLATAIAAELGTSTGATCAYRRVLSKTQAV